MRLKYKFLTYTIIIISTIIVISSRNIFIIWISIELNIFSFVIIILNKTTTNETESSINYFLSQALGSTIFILRIIIIIRTNWLIEINQIIIIIRIILKLGLAPCHYWYPTTIEILDWTNCILLSTWQKLAPLFIILYIVVPQNKKLIISIIIIINAIIGRIIAIRQKSIKKIIAYSSLRHIRWILAGIITNTPCLSVAYFIIYSIIIIPLFIIIKKENIDKIYESWRKKKLSTTSSLLIPLLIISISGLPPLIGFIPKILLINILIKFSTIVTIILVIRSAINIFFYIKIRINILIRNQINITKNKKKSWIFISTIIRINLISLIFIIL